ncbi:protein MAIN-LIKE 1-like [Vicia villosa]|uniref:protein MAIN-LIKE 1-like n=1 Tax=Vicia villosa TaxID=3911 RepID=UPI00273A99F6|nr:protein MAIN-LIKE 1-like [Vicia villosa]
MRVGVPCTSTQGGRASNVVDGQNEVGQMVRDALEVDGVVVLKEFGDTRGFHLRMSWLRKVYQQLVDAGRYEAAVRAYMLHLVACTLFADKSAYYINVHYLTLFSDLDTPSWAWGVAALTMLYTAFDAASRPNTRQLASYLSLLQCWIYEHFPRICERRIHHCAAADPCAMRWKAKQTFPGEAPLMEYRQRLDALTLDDVMWTPYIGHCKHRPFDPSSLYLGYVRWESHVARHLLERCLRQFGYLPREIMDTAVAVQQSGQCQDGYLEWFLRVSHHRVSPSAAASDVPGPSCARASSPPPPPPASDQGSLL